MERLIIFLKLILLVSCTALPTGEFVQYYQKETEKPYDDVLAELQVAIAENNFRITGHSRVGQVIRERGDKGFPDYDTIQFCNLTYAKNILLISPHAIGYMPCNVVVYKYHGKTLVRARLLPDHTDDENLNRFAEDINKLLKQIVDFAIEQ